MRCVKDRTAAFVEAPAMTVQPAEAIQEAQMPTTKSGSDAFAADRIMPAVNVEEGIELIKAQLASASVLPQKIWETQFAMASEILTFMGRRMQAQAEFCARLGHCTEFGEAVGVQQDFARGVGGAYADEAGKLSTLARKTMDAWTGASAQYVSNLTALQKKAA